MRRTPPRSLAIPGKPIQIIDSASYLNGAKYLRNIESDFTDSRLALKLGSLAQNELLLLPTDVSDISADLNNARITTSLLPGMEIGRQNSRSEVKFGQLTITGATQKPLTEQVAAKYTHVVPAVREFFAGRAVDRRFGHKMTYTPLGFASNQGKIGALSRYEHNVVSLDNILWSLNATPEQRLGAMAHAGVWLAELHNHGIIHGDAQAKNIAYSSDGEPRYIDLEGAADIHHGSLDNETRRLLDIGNLFDPQTSPTDAEPDEISTFIDYYSKTQSGAYGKLDGLDIMDTIDSMQETRR